MCSSCYFLFCYCFVGVPLVVLACVFFMCVRNLVVLFSFHVHRSVFSVLNLLVPYGSTCFLRSRTPNTSSEASWIITWIHVFAFSHGGTLVHSKKLECFGSNVRDRNCAGWHH